MKGRILIIEDDKSISQLERDYLEVAGYSADIQADGMAGREMALSGHYDLIILDIMLPNVNGFELLKEIRARLNIPVIMVSALGDEIDKIRGLGLGADDYIVKPFSPGELVARVGGNLTRYRTLTNGTRSNVIDLGDLVIECDARRVYKDGREIFLTNKEFDVLEFLAANPNRVFNRDQLMDKVWGVDSFGDIATVTVHIKRLREKIESDPSKPRYIETVWGAGYRFNI